MCSSERLMKHFSLIKSTLSDVERSRKWCPSHRESFDVTMATGSILQITFNFTKRSDFVTINIITGRLREIKEMTMVRRSSFTYRQDCTDMHFGSKTFLHNKFGCIFHYSVSSDRIRLFSNNGSY